MWTGSEPIEGSADAVQRLVHAGHEVVFVTNNSFSTIAEQEAKLARFGVDAVGRVMNSAMAGASLVNAGERAFVFGGPGIREALLARDVVLVDSFEHGDEAPDAVVVGLDWDLSYERLRIAVQAVLAGARLIATNHDPVYPTERGFFPGAGAFVGAVEAAVGHAAVVAGKPMAPMAALVQARYGAEGIMVGDRPDTDGAFAGALGYRFGLVLSGVTDEEQLPTDPPADDVAADLATMVDQLLG